MRTLTLLFCWHWPQVRILQCSVLFTVLAYNPIAIAYDDMVLGVPDFKPYTHIENNKITGSALPPIKSALTSLGVDAKIKLFPTYTDLLRALKRGDIQGFFLASQNPERDNHAQFSKPITINNWTWFTLKERELDISNPKFKRHSRVGTIEKTNTFRWLTRNGYQVRASQIQRLPSLLITGKVDAVFAAEAVFEKSCEELSINTYLFDKTVESGKPFSIYIAHTYLKENKGFMEDLNRYIENNIFKAASNSIQQ